MIFHNRPPLRSFLLFHSSPSRPEPRGALRAGGHPQEEGGPAPGDPEAPRGVTGCNFGGGGTRGKHRGQVIISSNAWRGDASFSSEVLCHDVFVLMPSLFDQQTLFKIRKCEECFQFSCSGIIGPVVGSRLILILFIPNTKDINNNYYNNVFKIAQVMT